MLAPSAPLVPPVPGLPVEKLVTATLEPVSTTRASTKAFAASFRLPMSPPMDPDGVEYQPEIQPALRGQSWVVLRVLVRKNVEGSRRSHSP